MCSHLVKGGSVKAIRAARLSNNFLFMALLMAIGFVSLSTDTYAENTRARNTLANGLVLQSAGFAKVEDFENLDSGTLNGQNGWNATEGVRVEADSELPGNFAMQVSGADQNAYRAMPNQVADGATGTLYFRMLQSGKPDGFAGSSDEAAPSEWASYEAQIGYRFSQSDQFRIRDGSRFHDIGTFTADQWHCVWLVMNSADNSYEAYVQGGAYEARTRLGPDGRSNYAFRNGGDEPLRTFLVRMGTAEPAAALQIDDVYIDADSINFNNPVGSCDGSIPPPAGFQKVDDFEGTGAGNIHGKNGWMSSGRAHVVADPEDADNSVMEVSGEAETAYKPLPTGISNNGSGTLHFRMLRLGEIDTFVGSSAQTAPSEWVDYETQIGYTNIRPNDFRARNGDEFNTISNAFDADTWYCIWMVADNSNDVYNIFVQGGAYSQPTQLNALGRPELSFRNGGDEPLKTLFVRSGINVESGLLLDDIYIDPSGTNLSTPGRSCTNDVKPPPTTFQEVEIFDGLVAGALNGQNGWNATEGSRVANDPIDSSNQVAQIGAKDSTAYKPLPVQVANRDSATLHFRVLRDGITDIFAGASDLPAPTEWDSFEAQFGSQRRNPSDFRLRDGDQFKTLSDAFANRSWYCVWLVADNATDRYEIYIQGGSYQEQTQLSASGKASFDFRNGGQNPLQSFFVRTGSNNPGDYYVDDIYLDPSGENLSTPGQRCQVDTPPQNGRPIARTDSATTRQDSELVGESVLKNDSDPDGDQLSVETLPVNSPSHGTLQLASDGTYFYMPEAQYTGSDTFVYRVCDDGSPSLCDEAEVSIEIRAQQEIVCHELALTYEGAGREPLATPSRSEGCARHRYIAGQAINVSGRPADGWRVERWIGTASEDSNQSASSLQMPNQMQAVVALYKELDDETQKVNLSIEHVEMSQAIQTESNTVPFVANRPTIARVYIKVQENDQPVQNVRAKLHAARNGVELPNSPIEPLNSNGTITAYPNPSRERIDGTLNFQLPDEWLQSGTLTVWAEVNGGQEVDESNFDDNRSTDLSFSFRDVPPLEIVLIPIAYQPGQTGPIYRPDLNDANNLGLGMLESIFPLDQVKISFHAEYYHAGNLQSTEGWGRLVSELAQLRQRERPNEPVHSAVQMPKYYGVLPMEASYWGGMAYINSTVGMGLVEQRDVAAHELGHNFGLFHIESSICGASPGGVDNHYPYANASIGNVGINSADYQLIPSHYREIMSYCWPKWISDYHYTKVLDVLMRAQSASGQLQASAAGREADVAALIVSGHIASNETTGEIINSLPISVSGTLTPSTTGAYAIKLIDTQQTVLYSTAFTPTQVIVEGEENGPLNFNRVVPRVPDLAQIQLWKGESLFDTLDAGSLPTISAALVANEDPSLIGIEWEIESASETKSTVRYSPDGGQSWQILAIDFSGTSLLLDTTKIPGSAKGTLEVAAHTTTEIASTRLDLGAIAEKAPVAAILASETIEAGLGETIILFGAAVDFEDGTLPDENLSWSIDGGDAIGTGSSLVLHQGLSKGTHTVTLTARDSSGKLATASIQILVNALSFQQVTFDTYLPILLR